MPPYSGRARSRLDTSSHFLLNVPIGGFGDFGQIQKGPRGMSAEGSSSQVRRIAILVTSLDASAGRQLLMAMPSDLARQVRRAMTQLGHVDPEEQRQILAEFRMQAMGAGDNGQVEREPIARQTAAPSHTMRDHGEPLEIGNRHSVAGTSVGGSSDEGNGALREPGLAPFGWGGRSHGESKPVATLDVQTLSELLRGERSTVVAVVLSQLEPRHGAELLGKLPKPLQREAIVSLSRIGQIDPEAMQAIDDHLSSRIADYHHRQAGESESTGRMHELLAAAAPELRSDWQNTLVQAEPMLASRLGIAPSVQAAAKETPRAVVKANDIANSVADEMEATKRTLRQPGLAPSGTASANGAHMLELLANNVVTTDDMRVVKTTTSSTTSSPAATKPLKQPAATPAPMADEADDEGARILPFPTKATTATSIRFEQILDLPAEQIGQILAAADTDVILYALAGASPAFMKRFMSMLDRADGRALQARLKQLRAINLQDVDAAQRRLCELASGQSLAKAA